MTLILRTDKEVKKKNLQIHLVILDYFLYTLLVQIVNI